MKLFARRILYIIVLVGSILWSTNFSVFAADYEQVECVILLDASGSMGRVGKTWGSDPEMKKGETDEITRVSIEAIKAFANNCPSFIDMKLSLVVYNHNCIKVTQDPVNIRTNGTGSIKRDLGKILAAQIKGIDCWEGYTDIAQALNQARDILDENVDSSVRKGVLLFTDGKIEIEAYNEDELEASAQESEDIVRQYKEDGIKFYSIGLNGKGKDDEDSIDRNFLDELGVISEQPPFIVNTTLGENLDDKLIGYFLDVYVDLLNIKKTVVEDVPIIGSSQDKTFNIYGKITKEANITISTNGNPLKRIEVFAPDNTDMTEDASIEINIELMSTTVKIKDPIADGNWKITFEGKEGDTAKITQIHLYDLSIKSKKMGDKFDVYLFNEFTEQRVTLSRLYEESVFKPVLVDKNDREYDINYETNDDDDGYVVDITGFREQAEEGIYSFKCDLNKEGYFSKQYIDPDVIEVVTLPTSETIDVNAPIEPATIELTPINGSTKFKTGDTVTFYAELLNERGISIEEYLDNKVVLSINGKEYDMDFSTSAPHCYVHTVTFNTEGTYAVKAYIKNLGGDIISSDTIDVEIIRPLPPLPWGTIFIVVVVIIVGIILIRLLTKKKIFYITINEIGKDSEKYTVVYRNPLLITTDGGSSHMNKYVVNDVTVDSALENINLAKIETCGKLQLPAFHKKIQVIKDCSANIEILQEPLDNIIDPQTDITLIFIDNDTQDKIKLFFQYETRKTKKRNGFLLEDNGIEDDIY